MTASTILVLSTSHPLTEEVCFMTCTTASHQVVIEKRWLHFWVAVTSSIFIYSNSLCFYEQCGLNTFLLQVLYNVNSCASGASLFHINFSSHNDKFSQVTTHSESSTLQGATWPRWVGPKKMSSNITKCSCLLCQMLVTSSAVWHVWFLKSELFTSVCAVWTALSRRHSRF